MIDPFAKIRPHLQAGDLAAARDGLIGYMAEYGDLPCFKVLYGQVLCRCDQKEKGAKLIEEVAGIKPETAAWAADLALGVFLLGNPQRAKELGEEAIKFSDAPASSFNLLGAIFLGEGDLDKAEDYFNQALFREPGRSEILSNLGGLAVRQGKLSDALAYYDRAISLNNQLVQAVSGRNSMLVALERSDEAVLDLEERIAAEPESVLLYRNLSYLLEAAGRFEESCQALKSAFELDEKCIATLLQFATIVMGHSQYRAALWSLLKAEELEPDNQIVLNMLLHVYIEMGKYDKAEKKINYLFELYPDAPGTLIARASLRTAKDDFVGAEADLRSVLTVLPGSAEAMGNLGHTLLLTGRISEAVELFEKTAAINPAALASLIEARSFPEDNETIEKMTAFVDNPLTAKGPRGAMAFALSKLFEKKKEYSRAFCYAHKGNDMIHKENSYDPQISSGLVAGIKSFFSVTGMHRLSGAGISSERPVFVVGMPRSGTTLTEQILCSHPDIFGAGELGFIPSITRLMPRVIKMKVAYPSCLKFFKKWMVRHAAAYYLKNINKMNRDAIRVVDKLPHNFLHLGLISLIFPNARIIHVKRDFRDIAISNYFTNFKHKHGGMAYAFSLTDIGSMINDYRRIMDHWRFVFPVPMYEFNYEDLVEDPEGKGRELLDFIGMDWNPQIMEFYKTDRPVKTASVWQVRQPIYKTSKARWRNYEEFLSPLFNVLDEYKEKNC